MYRRIETFNIKCLRMFLGNKVIKAKPGDKIIILREDKVLSGILHSVGTKYIELRYTPFIHKKGSYQWRSHKIAIESIYKFAVFPSCFQEYGHIYCNRKEQCLR